MVANITLTPICMGQLCRTEDYGRYYATAFTECSFGCLTSIQIAAYLFTVTEDSGMRSFLGPHPVPMCQLHRCVCLFLVDESGAQGHGLEDDMVKSKDSGDKG